MRRAAQRDRNEPAIVRRLQSHGFLWLPNSAKGRPDGCALRAGETYWCEVKVPGEPFTPAQMDTFADMLAVGVPVYVLETEDDATRLYHGTLPAWRTEAVKRVWSAAGGRKKQEFKIGVDRARTLGELCRMAGCASSSVAGDYFCQKHA